jgi:hypothetical protein
MMSALQMEILQLKETIKIKNRHIAKLLRELKIKNLNLTMEGIINKEFMDAVYEGRVLNREGEKVSPSKNEHNFTCKRPPKFGTKTEVIFKVCTDILTVYSKGLYSDELYKKACEANNACCGVNTFRYVMKNCCKEGKFQKISFGPGVSAIYTLPGNGIHKDKMEKKND